MNGLKTTLLLGVLSGLFLAIGYSYGGRDGMTIAFGFAIVMNVVSYWFSDKIVLSMYHAKEITAQESPVFAGIVADLAIRAQIPTPKLYLVNLPVPNAFATGRNPKHAAVAISPSLLSLLSENEVRAVIAHELGHVLNRDVLVSCVAATVASAVSSIASMLRWGMMFAGGSRDRNGQNPLAMLAMVILTPIIALIIQLAISRTREYGADDASAKLTGSPMDLANALRKLEYASQRMPIIGSPRQQTTASLFIVNPFKSNLMARWFSTHPPIEERIERLEEMARGVRRA
ncbi:MAG: M48 family metalloprotease [Candidatus Shapirobacteria bacterium]|jgi:heat shock protein HtpX